MTFSQDLRRRSMRPQSCGQKWGAGYSVAVFTTLVLAAPYAEAATTPGTRTFVAQLESCLATAQTLADSVAGERGLATCAISSALELLRGSAPRF